MNEVLKAIGSGISTVLEKLSSARFLMAVLMTVAGCIMAYNNKLSTEFCTIWGVVVAHYFGKTRPEESPLYQQKEKQT